jgi:hypothetical protein
MLPLPLMIATVTFKNYSAVKITGNGCREARIRVGMFSDAL